MAELIPIEYRVGVARARQIKSWSIVATIVAAIGAGSLLYTYAWASKRAAEYAALEQQERQRSVLITQAAQLQEKRRDLATRMRKMQEFRDDQLLLSLLKNVASAFSNNDCLEFVNIEAHPAARAATDKTPVDQKYTVRMLGMTASYTTHADLVNRLTQIGAKSDPPIKVPPDRTQRAHLFDGEVVHFEIACEPPDGKGT